MRVAVVDVGTNTTRLFVAEVQDGRVVEEVARVSRVVRLGAGVDRSGTLAEDAIGREHACLSDFTRHIVHLGADRNVAIMTSAVRDAANGEAFAAEVADRYGLDVRVITGEEEAALTYRGATDELAPGSRGRILVMDIGGGSTELILGRGRAPDFHVSTQAGVVRQADRHITGDPPTAGELDAVARDVRDTLQAAVPAALRPGVERALAVAGTPTSLAAIAQDLEPYDPARVHGYRLTASARDAIFERLRTMPLAERRAVRGLHPDRALAILPGIVILREVMALFALDGVEVSEHDILRGAALACAAER